MRESIKNCIKKWTHTGGLYNFPFGYLFFTCVIVILLTMSEDNDP